MLKENYFFQTLCTNSIEFVLLQTLNAIVNNANIKVHAVLIGNNANPLANRQRLFEVGSADSGD